MPCFAANASALRRSRAATHAISTSSTPFAGRISAIGAILAAPRIPIRSLPLAIALRVSTRRAERPTGRGRSSRAGAPQARLHLGLLVDRGVERVLDLLVPVEILLA